jgi:WD40 repeat protein
MLASGSYDNTVKVWEVGSAGTSQCESTLSGHSGSVTSVAWNSDGSKLATGSWDKTIRVWSEGSAGSFECQSTLSGHLDYVLGVCFSPDGSKLASCSGDRSVKIWNLITHQCVSTLSGHRYRQKLQY